MSPLTRLRRLEPIEKTAVKLGAFGAICLIVIIALVVAVVALSTAKNSKTTADTANRAASQAASAARNAQESAQADCGTWHDLTLIPPPATASESSLKLWAGFRNSYVHKGCVEIVGAVPPVDPRLAQYLDSGVH